MYTIPIYTPTHGHNHTQCHMHMHAVHRYWTGWEVHACIWLASVIDLEHLTLLYISHAFGNATVACVHVAQIIFILYLQEMSAQYSYLENGRFENGSMRTAIHTGMHIHFSLWYRWLKVLNELKKTHHWECLVWQTPWRTALRPSCHQRSSPLHSAPPGCHRGWPRSPCVEQCGHTRYKRASSRRGSLI